jgi:hypothetical protein
MPRGRIPTAGVEEASAVVVLVVVDTPEAEVEVQGPAGATSAVEAAVAA